MSEVDAHLKRLAYLLNFPDTSDNVVATVVGVRVATKKRGTDSFGYAFEIKHIVV